MNKYNLRRLPQIKRFKEKFYKIGILQICISYYGYCYEKTNIIIQMNGYRM